MNFKEKRHAKKMAKIFITLSYTMLIAFVVILIGGFIISITLEEEPKISNILMVIIGLTPMILCLVLGRIGMYFLNKRVYYKQAIAEYRQCTFFTKCIRLLMAGDENSAHLAVDIYNLINEDTPRKRFLFAFIIVSSYYSKDKKKAEKGRKRLDKILDEYNPEKISFKK